VPLFGSVASLNTSTRAASPRARRSPNRGWNATATCAVSVWNRCSSGASVGVTETIRNTPLAPNRLRMASVAASGVGSTIARRTLRTSVLTEAPNSITWAIGKKTITASVRRSRRM
jgi:hypothetical protein